MNLDKNKLKEYVKNAPDFDTDLINRLQDKEYQRGWLELTLNDFLTDGDLDTFIRCLTDVVKARVQSSGRGEISRLAKELQLDRSNLSEIVNGNKQPRLETALKLLNVLGYSYNISLKSA